MTKKRGRPRFEPRRADYLFVEEMALGGYSITQVRSQLKIFRNDSKLLSRGTFDKYYREAYQKGRQLANNKVAKTLYERALQDDQTLRFLADRALPLGVHYKGDNSEGDEKAGKKDNGINVIIAQTE